MDITEFDNDVSILYKEAQKLQVPTKLVQIKTEIRDGTEIKTYSNMIQDIQTQIAAGISLMGMATQFAIDPKDLAMIYAIFQSRAMELKDILFTINQFYEQIGINKIRDIAELRLLTAEFRKNLSEELEDEKEELEDILTIQGELESYPPLKSSPITLETIVLKADMLFKNKEPIPEDGYEIFDLSRPNSDIPYLRWNSTLTGDEPIFKLFTGKTLEERPDYSVVIPDSSGKEKSNSFRFTVWSLTGSKRYATKESFLPGDYDLDNNLMTIKIPIEKGNEKELITKRIEDGLPLKFNKINETAISGEFFVFDIDLDDLIFSHMVLNTDLLNIYLFQKEMTNSFAVKKHLKLFFRSATTLLDDEISSSVSFSLNQNYAKGGEIVQISDGTNMRLPSGYPYLRVNITSAENLQVAERFVKIFTRLLEYYKQKKESIIRIYESFIPELSKTKDTNGILTSTTKKAGKMLADTKINRLKNAAPELFISGYARKCLCHKQPISIPDNEIKAWQNKTFVKDGKTRKRQVMKFPPNKPIWNFVCPEDSYPYPGVKYNDLENKDEFPGLPCCFVNEQMKKGINSNYNQIYVKGLRKKEKEPGTEHIVKTDKILGSERYGLLPSSISDLLSNYSPESGTILRRGVPRSVNSLLHCISIAVKDPKYLGKKTDKGKETYVGKLRKVIAQSVKASLLKQEMYDFSDDEILGQLGDNDLFLDPNLFYRAIEDAYKNINIYVFAPSYNEIKRLKTKSETVGVMQLPRFKLIYARVPRPENMSIIIYRTLGSESDNLEYPQCELIIDQREDEDIGLFESDMGDFLFNTYLQINKTISWELVNDVGKIETLARENIYSKLNYYELFRREPTKQYIDGFGKLRGLVVEHNEEQLLMVIPSSQPENLDVVKEIPRASLTNVLSFIRDPVAVSKKEDQIDGLWFRVLDIVYGIYIPIVPTEDTLGLPQGPTNPLGEEELNIVPRIRKLQRDLDFIQQILIWIYLIALSTEKINIRKFYQKYISVGTGSEKSETVYDFKDVGRTFPEAKTVKDAIDEMRNRIPTLFRGDKIYLYSQNFANGTKYLLSQYVKEYVNRFTQIPKVITRKFISETDFIQYPAIVLFLSEKDLRNWLNTLDKLSFKNLQIFRDINVKNTFKTEPYLYQSPDGHIYMVQNVMQGTLERALNVGWYWDQYKVNPGYRIDEFIGDISELKYVVWDISSNIIVLGENFAGDTTEFLSVLRYSVDNYAAMLRLL